MKTQKAKFSLLKQEAVVALSAVLCAGFLPQTSIESQAAETIVCDISQGDVIIGNIGDITNNNDKIIYTDSNGTVHEGESLSSIGNIVITGETDEHTVMVRNYDNSPVNITFRDLTIDVTSIPADGGVGYKSTCAVYFGGESESWPEGRVKLTLEGENVIKSLDYAGIAVPQGETLTIQGDGSLDVESVLGNAGVTAPAIGCGQDSDLGSILITGGTIEATGSNGGPGIGGGGMHTNSGVITITGGDITANGGNNAPGIGGSNVSGYGHGYADQIRISGGTIRAYGGRTAAGIGAGGPAGLSDDIEISGGTIYAYGGVGSVSKSETSDRRTGSTGLQTSGNGAGSGIGNSEANFSITNWTDGTLAGTTSVSGDAKFGGKIKITGGEIHAYSGTITGEERMLAANAGFSYIEAQAIGNGGYAGENVSEDNPYVACDTTISGGTVYENDVLVYAEEKGGTVATNTNLGAVSITGISDAEYTGQAITPVPTVTVNGNVLTQDKDYIVSYTNNVNVGTATVIVTGMGDYSGQQAISFKITAPKVAKSKVKKVTVKKNKLTVKVKKVAGATGYQIYYKAAGQNKWKVKTIGTKAKTTLKSLKSGKKYKIKVYALKKVGDTTFKSKVSAVKTTKKVQ